MHKTLLLFFFVNIGTFIMDILYRTVAFYRLPRVRKIYRSFMNKETDQRQFVTVMQTGQFVSHATGPIRHEVVTRCAMELTRQIIEAHQE